LKLDDNTFEWVNGLRQQYFPVEKNFLPAHVTLFHALPGEHLDVIQARLAQLCRETPQLSLHFPTLRFLGQGVAIELHCPDLVQLRQALVIEWQDWLTAQDRHTIRPHITIQNKVTPDAARQTYDVLQQNWRSRSGHGEGLLLWSYQGGPWKFLDEFLFYPPS
jgi:hypothetical protein